MIIGSIFTFSLLALLGVYGFLLWEHRTGKEHWTEHRDKFNASTIKFFKKLIVLRKSFESLGIYRFVKKIFRVSFSYLLRVLAFVAAKIERYSRRTAIKMEQGEASEYLQEVQKHKSKDKGSIEN